MIRPGLCSVTFRALSCKDIVDLTVAAGVEAIEWGADIQVPVGDAATARRIGDRTRDAGIAAASYGSCLCAGTPGARADFAPVLDTALELGAGNIRLWAGDADREASGRAVFERAAGDLSAMADEAAAVGVMLSLEFHCRTLTERAEDALAPLERADRPNLFTYWQPLADRDRSQHLREIAALQPHLCDLHAFHWTPAPAGHHRRPLSEGRDEWSALLAAWRRSPRWPSPPTAYLEFVRDDAIAQFRADMRVLRALCRTTGAGRDES